MHTLQHFMLAIWVRAEITQCLASGLASQPHKSATLSLAFKQGPRSGMAATFHGLKARAYNMIGLVRVTPCLSAYILQLFLCV